MSIRVPLVLQLSIMKDKRNYLLDSIINIFSGLPRGKVLDLGCGDGDYSKGLADLGFEVTASDIDCARFKYKDSVGFQPCDINKDISFAGNSFDYLLLLEVVEHLRNPYVVLSQINRIMKPNGCLFISTPNVLNLKSRVRFLFEGTYEYFREPPLDQVKNPKEVIFNLHIAPYRYHELEYSLAVSGFKVAGIFTSIYEGRALSFLLPILMFQAWQKQRRSTQKGGLDFQRINRIILSKELLYGRHLIIKAVKE